MKQMSLELKGFKCCMVQKICGTISQTFRNITKIGHTSVSPNLNERRGRRFFFCVHGAIGAAKKLNASVTVPPAPLRVPIQRTLAPVVTSVTYVG